VSQSVPSSSSVEISDREKDQFQIISEKIPSPEEIEDEIAFLVSQTIKARVDEEGLISFLFSRIFFR
jgi:hypothetical protein